MSDKAAEVIATGVVFLLLPVVSVALRFYARKLLNAFGWDDWLIIPALICCTGAEVAQLYGAAAAGLGQHHISTVVPPITPGAPLTNDENTIKYEKSKYVISVLATLAIGFAKISVLLLYRRLFGQDAKFRYVVNVALAIIITWTIGFSFSLIFQCSPVEAAWNIPEYLLTPYCFKFTTFYTVLPITDIITDLAVLLMPIPMVWRLQLPLRQRFAVGGIFLLGALVCAASITRLAIFEADLFSFASMDETYNAADTIVWTTIESSLSIISACLPTFRPLFITTSKRVPNSHSSNVSRSGHSLKALAVSRGDHSLLNDESTIGYDEEYDGLSNVIR